MIAAAVKFALLAQLAIPALAQGNVDDEGAEGPISAEPASSGDTAMIPEMFAGERDFRTKLAQRAQFPLEDRPFVYSFETVDEETQGGNLRGHFVGSDPFLATQVDRGTGQNLITLEACGINQPHNHPRGVETAFMTEGDVMFGTVEENGGRVAVYNITKGEVFSIPQGIMHFAQNLGCERAQFISAFGTRDPGTQTIASNLLRVPTSVLRGTLQIPDEMVELLRERSMLMSNPSIDPECAKRCGIEIPEEMTYSMEEMMGGMGMSGGSSSGGMVKRWGQCGGKHYSGPTECEDGTSCVTDSEWYSQCRPN